MYRLVSYLQYKMVYCEKKKVDKKAETLTRNIMLFLAFQHSPSLLYQSLIPPLVM